MDKEVVDDTLLSDTLNSIGLEESSTAPNSTLLSDTLKSIGLTESVVTRREVWL